MLPNCCSHARSVQPYIFRFEAQKNCRSTLGIVGGLTIIVGGFLIILATYQFLPHGVNGITILDLGGYVTGLATIGIGSYFLTTRTIRVYQLNFREDQQCSEQITPIIDYKSNWELFISQELSFLGDRFNSLGTKQKMAIAFWLMNLRAGSFTIRTQTVLNWEGSIAGTLSYDPGSEYSNFIQCMKAAIEHTTKPSYYSDYEYNVNKILNLINDLSEGKEVLDIQVSAEEMLAAFETYGGIILLRPLRSDELILKPIMRSCMEGQSYEKFNEIDSVDQLLFMNPTVCCSWSNAEQSAYFAGRYKIIYGYMISDMPNQRAFYQQCRDSLNAQVEQPLLVLPKGEAVSCIHDYFTKKESSEKNRDLYTIKPASNV